MLYLTRRIGESIIINNNIELTVVDVRGKTVKLGFLFPKEASILRKELHQKILEQNIAAAGGEGGELDDIEFTINIGNADTDKDDGR
jgi:carbon storage regulator